MNRRNFIKRFFAGLVGAVVPLPHPKQMGGFIRAQDFPTIRAAIDAAQDGDVVLVASGVYGESLIPPPIPESPTMTVAILYQSQDGRRFFSDTIFDNDPIWREV